MSPAYACARSWSIAAPSAIIPDTTAQELYDGYVAKLNGGGATLHRHLGDGRIIKLNHRPMEHGGWVITYEDVTERHGAEARWLTWRSTTR